MSTKKAPKFPKELFIHYDVSMGEEDPVVLADESPEGFAVAGETKIAGVYRLQKIVKIKAAVTVE